MMQPDALLEPRDQRRIVSDILSHLTVREQDVLSRRFGLNRPEPETLQIISDQLGLSRERIRQIEKRALERLRQAYTNLGDLTGN
ncbi:hypothetical protein CF392_15770 [Tamilnaduibacter salinus]|nr:hypothetical protein CF392_15770 [Tamilnaduibacter salinus]